MHSEMRRPVLPDTPETFSRIESALLHEAAAIRARQATPDRRRRVDPLRPALGLVPLALIVAVFVAPILDSPPVPESGTVEATHSTVVGSYRDRVPQEDLALIEVSGTERTGFALPSNMLRLMPA